MIKSILIFLLGVGVAETVHHTFNSCTLFILALAACFGFVVGLIALFVGITGKYIECQK